MSNRAPKELVVEEVVIIEEDAEEGEEGDWVLGEDGFWYCTVEEVEEVDEEDVEAYLAEKSSITNKKAPRTEPKLLRERASSMFSLPESLRTGTPCLIEIRSKNLESRQTAKTLEDIPLATTKSKGRSPSLLRRNRRKVPSPTSIAKKPKSTQSSPNIVTKKEKKHERNGSNGSLSTLSMKSEGSPLSRFRAKQQAASNKMALSNRIENMRQRGKDKIFGETIENLILKQKGKIADDNPPSVPKVVFYFVEYIRKRGLRTSGLFRECGRHSTQLEKEGQIEAGVPLDELGLDDLDIHTVADILKSFFRQLPEPIIPRVPFCSLLIQESGIPDIDHRIAMYATIVRALPATRFEFLVYFVKFLGEIAEHKETNLMDTANVAKIFSCLLLGSLDHDMKKNKTAPMDPMLLFMETTEIAEITKIFIDGYDRIFTGTPGAPRIYRAIEEFKPTSKSYMTIMKEDIVVFIKDTPSGVIVAIDQTIGEIPNSILSFNMKQVKLSSLHVAEVKVILERKRAKGQAPPLLGRSYTANTQSPQSKT